ncbi:endolytic transglycosylase MltG [Rhodobaculum claviforme]|uniref:Endolytic murein transglycosylase n=1 Tax=Rhodobaculum claviforme TaxID=1549854 RepID=A0A934TI99_9RHOB|nr:endolytic transglycosylase MltG [Rhodobaculum claviforme]MBK5926021.1 branched-chain alpha-keto acid dehydrogenase subunit E2 [Rhodobaculum claviforme]
MARHIAANALTLLIVALVALAVAVGWGQHQFTAAGPLQEAVCVRVERGASLQAVSQQLEAQGAIRSGLLFRVGARYTERADRLRFGAYLVPPGASMDEILGAVTRGGPSTCGTEVQLRIGVTQVDIVVRDLDPATARFEEVMRFGREGEPPAEYAELAGKPDTRFRVTVVEGTTVWQVVEGLRWAEFLEGEIAEMPPEGMLAPDSYEVRRGDDRGALVAEMQARQERILADLWAGRVDGLPITTPQEAMILASIIEKETSVPEERRQVASVFVNRLRVPMRLQTDPTVIYGVTLGQGTLGRGLRRSELDTRTPWNTYQIDGLPPTPIANPGRASIAAALDPDDTPYIYFVADGTGGHAFATNLADHNRNVARWRQIEAERRATQP